MDLSFWRIFVHIDFIGWSNVSILVMMDLSFWQRKATARIPRLSVSILVMMDLSFWLKSEIESQSKIKFQSLLWWICHFDSRNEQNRTKGDTEFQSLLWWICHFDNTSVLIWIFFRFVSILVMMDLSFWLFLCHLFLFDFGVSILVMMDLSFWQHSSCISCQWFSRFQSLLWWICHFDTGERNPMLRSDTFQSLLWWICHFDNHKSPIKFA